MDAAMKAKWIEALRSGKYQQTKNSLKDDKGYCCLGVLCDISGEGKWKEANGLCLFQTYEAEGDEFLPFDLREKYDLDLVEIDLTEMNDKKGKSFAEIADWIEANL